MGHGPSTGKKLKTTQIEKNSIRTLKLHLSNDVVMEMKVEIGHRGGYFNAWF